jgi:hypothetical protein
MTQFLPGFAHCLGCLGGDASFAVIDYGDVHPNSPFKDGRGWVFQFPETGRFR